MIQLMPVGDLEHKSDYYSSYRADYTWFMPRPWDSGRSLFLILNILMTLGTIANNTLLNLGDDDFHLSIPHYEKSTATSISANSCKSRGHLETSSGPCS